MKSRRNFRGKRIVLFCLVVMGAIVSLYSCENDTRSKDLKNGEFHYYINEDKNIPVKIFRANNIQCESNPVFGRVSFQTVEWLDEKNYTLESLQSDDLGIGKVYLEVIEITKEYYLVRGLYAFEGVEQKIYFGPESE